MSEPNGSQDRFDRLEASHVRLMTEHELFMKEHAAFVAEQDREWERQKHPVEARARLRRKSSERRKPKA